MPGLDSYRLALEGEAMRPQISIAIFELVWAIFT